jgi:hypothetical protein
MRKLIVMLGIVALCGGVAAVPASRADDTSAAKQQSGTVVAVEEDVVRVKGSDGKEYEIDATIVAAEDLKTGDVVEYAIVDEKPVRVKKKN